MFLQTDPIRWRLEAMLPLSHHLGNGAGATDITECRRKASTFRKRRLTHLYKSTLTYIPVTSSQWNQDVQSPEYRLERRYYDVKRSFFFGKSSAWKSRLSQYLNSLGAREARECLRFSPALRDQISGEPRIRNEPKVSLSLIWKNTHTRNRVKRRSLRFYRDVKKSAMTKRGCPSSFWND